MEITKRQFAFTTKNEIPLYFVSASDGTNVVKVNFCKLDNKYMYNYLSAFYSMLLKETAQCKEF